MLCILNGKEATEKEAMRNLGRYGAVEAGDKIWGKAIGGEQLSQNRGVGKEIEALMIGRCSDRNGIDQ